ncbi:MAG: STAS domain-containing protein [Rhodothermales bacterium]
MPFATRERNEALVFEITGKFLGSIDGPAFKETLDTHKEAGARRVVVDLSRTDLMDSTGIGVLIAGLTSMRNAGGDMCLAALKKRVRNVFLMTRLLGSVFEDYETLEEALADFNEAAG